MRRHVKKTLLSLCLFLPTSLLTSAAQAETTVLTTIKPLQLISTAITDGVAKTELLLPVNASPHDYQLKPSDMRKLAKANIIVWVGPELEGFLSKAIAQQSSSTVLTLGETLIDRKKSEHEDEEKHSEHDHDESTTHEDHEEHEHDEHAKHEEHEEHEEQGHENHNHGGADPHIWLSPKKAIQIAQLIADELKVIDADNKALYNKNLTLFIERVKKADTAISAQLKPYHDEGYFVFHNAYSSFEQHYDLKHLGAFTLSPERKPGAKHLQEIQQIIKTKNAQCVFREPQFQPRIIDAVTHGLSINVGVLDPLASDIGVDTQGYVRFMHQLADQFQQCLAPR